MDQRAQELHLGRFPRPGPERTYECLFAVASRSFGPVLNDEHRRFVRIVLSASSSSHGGQAGLPPSSGQRICLDVSSQPLLGVKLRNSPVVASKVAAPAFTSTFLPLASRR
jgi:hypothetical protein